MSKKTVKKEIKEVKTEVKEVYVTEQSTPLKVEKPIEEKKVEEKPAVLSL
tara:strand:+ start:471 stop:620 length:150 start_codon:yes stop_codon:yes gene_type:complete